MHFNDVKKQLTAITMFLLLLLYLFHRRPAFQCQISSELATRYPTPTIYGITPTYARLTQKADLTKLSQTLMLVKNFHWIVVEDSETKTNLVKNLLKESALNYTHLHAKTQKVKNSFGSGVEQRNAGLNWLRQHLNEKRRGIVYFMDDDNTYSLKVFDEMRKVKIVGVWPVGLVGGMRVEMPLVSDGRVTGYNAIWKLYRPFPIDMAGFAINATLFLEHPEAAFSKNVQSGFQESEILKYLTTMEELEPLAENCTKVYVWHTRTQKPTIADPKKMKHPPMPDDHIEV